MDNQQMVSCCRLRTTILSLHPDFNHYIAAPIRAIQLSISQASCKSGSVHECQVDCSQHKDKDCGTTEWEWLGHYWMAADDHIQCGGGSTKSAPVTRQTCLHYECAGHCAIITALYRVVGHRHTQTQDSSQQLAAGVRSPTPPTQSLPWCCDDGAAEPCSSSSRPSLSDDSQRSAHFFLPQQPSRVSAGQVPPRPSGLEVQLVVLQQAAAKPGLQEALLAEVMSHAVMDQDTLPPCISLRLPLLAALAASALGSGPVAPVTAIRLRGLASRTTSPPA